MAIVSETFSAAPSGFSLFRGSVALSRITTDNTGAILSTTNGAVRNTNSLGGLDQFAEMNLTAPGVGADRSFFLYTRLPSTITTTTSTHTYYALTGNANNGTMTVLRYNANTVTNLSGTLTGQSYSAGDLMQFRTTGTGSAVTLTAVRNGAQIYTIDDTASNRIVSADATFAGLGFFNCGTSSPPPLRVDNWRAGLLSDLAPAGPELGRGLLAA